MHVVGGVTIIAALWRIAMLLPAFVTIGTNRLPMFALQCEVGEVMIKSLLIEIHDVRSAAIVIRMTARAGALLRIRKQAVIAEPRADVIGNLFVTVKTKRALLVTFECFVAVAALRLDVGVALHQFAGHDQRFYLCRYWLRQGHEKNHHR